MSDDEVVLAYKNNNEDDLENELLSRYKIHTRRLAGELYRKFSFLYQVEYDDILCIVTANIFIAVNNFKHGMRNFYKYWRSTATNEVYSYVGQFSSLEVECRSLYSGSNNGEEKNYHRMMRQNESSLMDNYPLINDIARIIEKDNDNYKEIDKQIFFLFVEGYTYYEIAVFLGIKYNAVRRRMNKIKDKINDILFNQ